MAPPSPPLIKGYLPLRVSFPDTGDGCGDTFLFVKAHVGRGSAAKGAGGGGGGAGNSALFVANAPSVPGVRTRLFLRSLFERFGEVERATVVRNPRSGGGGGTAPPRSGAAPGGGSDAGADAATAAGERLFAEQSARFADCRLASAEDRNDEGKFAHVVFASGKELTRALRAMKGAMAGKRSRGDAEDGAPASVRFGALELQELRDQSEILLKAEATEARGDEGVDGAGGDSGDESEGGDDRITEKPTGLNALVERHRSAYVPRSQLLDACNAVMARYEEAEEEAERRARAAREGPDEDGFITVTHGPSVKQDLEENVAGGPDGAAGGRRKAGKRSRGKKKKDGGGAAELKDFYRFQMKESRKRSLQELRKRFEEDLAKVKKMKEDKKYRPF